jgi:hypothetical protein
VLADMNRIDWDTAVVFLIIGGLTAPLFGFAIWLILSAFTGNTCPA